MAKRVTITEKPDLSLPLDSKLLGQVIRYKRTSLDMTLEDAASLCDLSKQAYNNIEKGVGNVRVETLIKAIHALGIKVTIDPMERADDNW